MRIALAAAALTVGFAAIPLHGQGPSPLLPPRWIPGAAASPATAAFALRVGGRRVPLRVMALAVLPGDEVEITREGTVGGRLDAIAGGGRLRSDGPDAWRWAAPDRPGFHTLRFASDEARDTIHLTMMVMRPLTDARNGSLDEYEIGRYSARPASMSEAYEPPRGLVEAHPSDYDILVSPNFKLGDFLCKQPGEPRYLLASSRLLVKLEALLAAVNEAGYPTPALTVMSGFRTPAYNRAIGNTTDFSRHLWGDAADVYVDVDGDGHMDDLNRDGRSNIDDARWLAGIVEGLMAAEGRGLRPGGLAVYRPNAVHGPFVHVDTRGHRARW
jgi:hypothetical protein